MTLRKFEATPTLQNGQVVWKLCYTNPNPDQCGTTNATYPDVTVATGIVNEPFQFKIVNDNTGLDIKFADSNPLWVQQGAKPTGPGVDPQIPQAPGGAGTKVLTFVDLNDNQGQIVLKYQLNFTDGKGNPVTPIDPDITNGGKAFAYETSAMVVAIGVAVMAILLFAWWRTRAARINRAAEQSGTGTNRSG